jgi:superoxide dismutase, Fe-Mn family
VTIRLDAGLDDREEVPMSESSNSAGLGRRRFLTMSAAGAVTTATLAEPARAATAPDGPAKGSAPLTILAKPLPEKVFTTEAFGISRKTHTAHYALYQGYVRKVNELRAALSAYGVPEAAKANSTYSDLREMKVEYSFALNGVKNHELYFNHIGGRGGDPNGPIGDLLTSAFGSFDNWKADLKATGIAARGWVWLAHDHTDGSLFNYIGDSQNTFPVWYATPLLGLDVYEHAYFIDFDVRRSAYIDAFFKVIDWDAVNANLKVAMAVADAAVHAR